MKTQELKTTLERIGYQNIDGDVYRHIDTGGVLTIKIVGNQVQFTCKTQGGDLELGNHQIYSDGRAYFVRVTSKGTYASGVLKV